MEQFIKICKKLLFPHWAWNLLLTPLTAAALVWVFLTGRQESWIAYPVYVLSFYALTVLCIRLIPFLIRVTKQLKIKKASMTPEDRRKRFHISLLTGLGMNLVYALLNLIMGAATQSAWVVSQGAYHLVLTLIHLVLMGYERRIKKSETEIKKLYIGWSGFQTTGILLMLLHLTMAAQVFQMIWNGEAEDYPGVMIFAVAAFTFYKLIIAIIRVAQYRKNTNPIWGAARNIDLSEAMMSLYMLQAAMLSIFGTGQQDDFRFLMNALTGGVVCLLAVAGAVGMIFHGKRKKKESLGEDENGK